MNQGSLLLRQVHPTWAKEDGTAASLAFWPFRKDKGRLSVDDGDRVSAENSWKNFTSRPGCSSAGVWGFAVQDAAGCDLPTVEAGVADNPYHAEVDLSAFPEKMQKAKAKVLSAKANARGCLFKPARGPGGNVKV